MKRKKKERPLSTQGVSSNFYDELTAMIMADPRLTDEEKAEIIRISELPDELYEPLEIEGEPLSETIIKMRGPRP